MNRGAQKVSFSREEEAKALLFVSSIIHQSQRLSPGLYPTGDTIAELWKIAHSSLKLPPRGHDYILSILKEKKVVDLQPNDVGGKSEYGIIKPRPGLREFWQQIEKEQETERQARENLKLLRRQDSFNRMIAVTGAIIAINTLFELSKHFGIQISLAPPWNEIFGFIAFILILATLAVLARFIWKSFEEIE